MNNTRMKGLLAQLTGKTVTEQASAANAESWMVTPMIKGITTYEQLNYFVTFAATVNNAEGDADMQKAYAKLGNVIDEAERDASTKDNAASIKEVLTHIVAALANMQKGVQEISSAFADWTGDTTSSATENETQNPQNAEASSEMAIGNRNKDKPELSRVKDMTMTREEFADRHILGKVGGRKVENRQMLPLP